MTVPVQSQIFNPITGVFGTGQVQIFGAGQSGVWYVPPGVGKARVRLWGAGGSGANAGGGGFALKTIYDLSGVTSVAVIVAEAPSGTSSFGSYVSATGGLSSSPYSGGTGVGGDINTSGGTSGSAGAGSLFGRGGSSSAQGSSGWGGSGVGNLGASGFLGSGGGNPNTVALGPASQSGMSAPFSLDFIGTGGGAYSGSGTNGGGGTNGGYPGGAGFTNGAPGMVIVEY